MAKYNEEYVQLSVFSPFFFLLFLSDSNILPVEGTQ